MTEYNKLVRDKIPQIIEADGGRPITRILDDGEYLLELTLKLQEEAKELTESPSIDELADVKEVFLALCRALDISIDKVEEARRQKAAARGQFVDRIFLESVEE